jgi:flagellar biosynthetic protein FlhB
MAGPENTGTEAPTPKRREDAREEGQVVFSPDLTASIALLAGCLVLLWSGSTIAVRLMEGFRRWFAEVPSEAWGVHHVSESAHWMTSELVAICGLLVPGVMVIGVAFGFAQVGFHFSFQALEIKWERLLPENGFSKIVSMESGIAGLMNVAKVTLLLCVSVICIWIKRAEFSVQNHASVASLTASAWRLGLYICIAMAGVSLGLALIDYLVKWFRNEQKLMMSREEIKQEQKDDSGDPHLKAAIRKKQREARRRQSVRDVPKATVILTNPTHLAIAIQYEPGQMKAPRIVAKGAGVFAKNIVRIAKENNIPVLERKPLARALFKSVDVGQEIPFDFFRAIAEILAQIYKTKQAA